MTILKGELQADNGDVLYPHTSSQCVFAPDGKTVEQQINVLSDSTLRFRGDLIKKDIYTLNKLEDRGIYRILECTNCNGVTFGILTIENEGNYGKFIIQDNTTGVLSVCRKNDRNEFTDWTQIATTDKTIIPIPFSSGYKHNKVYLYGSNIQKDSLKTGKVWISVVKMDGTEFEANRSHCIAVLPAGFLSTFNVVGHAVGSNDHLSSNYGGTCAAILFNNGIYVSVSVACSQIYGYIEYEVV